MVLRNVLRLRQARRAHGGAAVVRQGAVWEVEGPRMVRTKSFFAKDALLAPRASAHFLGHYGAW